MIFILAAAFASLWGDMQKTATTSARDDLFSASVALVVFGTSVSGTSAGVLESPNVVRFESLDHRELSNLFHNGIADHIPFGTYWMEVHKEGFWPSTIEVAVYRRRVTVVMSLTTGNAPDFPIMPVLHGKVVGRMPIGKKSFAKLVGVLSSHSLESEINSDGEFDFGVPWNGHYMLLVANQDGLLASRPMDIPYTGPPLAIRIGENVPEIR